MNKTQKVIMDKLEKKLDGNHHIETYQPQGIFLKSYCAIGEELLAFLVCNFHVTLLRTGTLFIEPASTATPTTIQDFARLTQ